MKSVVSRIVVALLLVTITGVAAFAKSQKTTVTFAVDTKVNETVVKRGTYEVIFNEERGELSILKGRKVVAKGTARLEMREGRARATELHTVKDGNDTAFVSIAFDGNDQKVVLNQAGMQAGGND
ncbi:MAG TPA: hypothetical protein VE135_18490 [Pyrinomonadaceae bacterium]|nr:hypothetical protein [Pyrinomonadaceae bacterium]